MKQSAAAAVRRIFIHDNLAVLRGMNSDSVDLIYLDPPFNSNRRYEAPIGSKAAGTAFKDTWSLSDVDEVWHGEIADHNQGLYDVISAARTAHGKGMMSYLIMMAVRLIEMERILKPAGSIYLHCDDAAGAYLKILMDAVFGKNRFRNEIIWKRTAGRSDAQKFGRVHDIIFYYAGENATWNTQYLPHDPTYVERAYRHEDDRGRWQSADLTANGRGGDGYSLYYEPWRGAAPPPGRMWNAPAKGGMAKWIRDHVLPDWPKAYPTIHDKLDALDEAGLVHWSPGGGMPRLKRYLAASKGRAVEDIFSDIGKLEASSKEKVGYPTQKPLALLERFIEVSSNEGDVVLDPFCGCATTCVAAEKLGRQWIGIDVSPIAKVLVKNRLADELGLSSVNVKYYTEPHSRSDLEVVELPPGTTEKHYLYGKQEGKCAGCLVHFPFRNQTVDHIVPKVDGGPDHLSNYQLLCQTCNSTKGDRTNEEFIARLIEQGIRKAV